VLTALLNGLCAIFGEEIWPEVLFVDFEVLTSCSVPIKPWSSSCNSDRRCSESSFAFPHAVATIPACLCTSPTADARLNCIADKAFTFASTQRCGDIVEKEVQLSPFFGDRPEIVAEQAENTTLNP